MHAMVRRVVYVCMFALVIEGALFVPFLAVWYGFPTLGFKEICDELHKVMYSNPDRECAYPYPLFGAAEGSLHADLEATELGVTPVPGYRRVGFRELIKIRDLRLAALKAGDHEKLEDYPWRLLE